MTRRRLYRSLAILAMRRNNQASAPPDLMNDFLPSPSRQGSLQCGSANTERTPEAWVNDHTSL